MYFLSNTFYTNAYFKLFQENLPKEEAVTVIHKTHYIPGKIDRMPQNKQLKIPKEIKEG
jgi:hypothetical protein